MKLFRFFRKRKEEIATPEMQIMDAQTQVNNAFIMFQQAQDSIDEANKKLDCACKEFDKEIESLRSKLEQKEASRQRALDEMKANNGLSEKIAPFVK